MNGSVIGYGRFWFWPFNLWSHPVSLRKNAPKVQKVILFLIWRGEEIGAWLWRNWIVGWFDFFFFFFTFLDLSHLHGETGFKVGTKKQTLDLCCFSKNAEWFLEDYSNTVFLCSNISLVKVSAKLDHIWGLG